jgi:hypothetical protein
MTLRQLVAQNSARERPLTPLELAHRTGIPVKRINEANSRGRPRGEVRLTRRQVAGAITGPDDDDDDTDDVPLERAALVWLASTLLDFGPDRLKAATELLRSAGAPGW